MTTTFNAIFEHGVLKPTEPVDLTEGLMVRVVVSEATRQRPTLEEANRRLDELAAMSRADGPTEYTSRDHDKILYGGKDAR